MNENDGYSIRVTRFVMDEVNVEVFNSNFEMFESAKFTKSKISETSGRFKLLNSLIDLLLGFLPIVILPFLSELLHQWENGS